MKNILSKQHPTASSQEDNPPSPQDNWARKRIMQNIHETDQLGARVSEIEEFVEVLKIKIKTDEWQEFFVHQPLVYRSIKIPINIKATFEKLEEDFPDFSNRIIWCNELKNCLSNFEEELERYDAKYLSWFVSTLKDVFSYNYAETITGAQLDLLRNGIEIIYEKQENCDKDSFAEYHLQLVESGISLLPTTQKAIDEFGE